MEKIKVIFGRLIGKNPSNAKAQNIIGGAMIIEFILLFIIFCYGVYSMLK